MNVGIEEKEGVCRIVCGGGEVLFTRYTVTTCDDWQDTPFGRVNFGWVMFGPSIEYIRHPDGREEQSRHLPHIMGLIGKSPDKKLSWWRRILRK